MRRLRHETPLHVVWVSEAVCGYQCVSNFFSLWTVPRLDSRRTTMFRWVHYCKGGRLTVWRCFNFSCNAPQNFVVVEVFVLRDILYWEMFLANCFAFIHYKRIHGCCKIWDQKHWRQVTGKMSLWSLFEKIVARTAEVHIEYDSSLLSVDVSKVFLTTCFGLFQAYLIDNIVQRFSQWRLSSAVLLAQFLVVFPRATWDDQILEVLRRTSTRVWSRISIFHQHFRCPCSCHVIS